MIELVSCPECGNQLDYIEQEGRWFCAKCRYSQESALKELADQYKPMPSQIPKPRSVKAILAISVAIIVITASIAYFFLVPTEEDDFGITIYDVSDIRGLDVLYDVPVNKMTREELRYYMTKSINPESYEDTRLILDSLFLMDYEDNLTQILVDSYSSQVYGFYDSASKEMTVIEGSSSILDRVILSHEYTHALQDQHFDLMSFMNVTDSDEAAAREALIEGDAMYTMMLYIKTLTTAEQMKLADELDQMNDTTDIPYVVNELMNFPYVRGLTFVQELYNQSGWNAVNDAFENPPRSTEQIMHQQKYYEYETPLNVTYEPEVQGMTKVFSETMGEFVIYIMLEHYIDPENASSAAEGWGGDQFLYYKNDTGFLSVLRIEWDSIGDAQEFNDTYYAWMDALPSKYDDIKTNDCLQIDLVDDATTIYFASDSSIIDEVRG